MSEKRIITDTERIDFIEKRSQDVENLFGEGRETGWCTRMYAGPMRCAKDDIFAYDTLREAIDAAIMGENSLPSGETV